MPKKQRRKESKGSVGAREFYNSVHWPQWWNEFCYDLGQNGTIKYRTVWQFVKAKAETRLEQDVLWWVIGPPVSEVELEKGAPKFDLPQFDWADKRANGSWYVDAAVRELEKNISESKTAIEKLAAVGKLSIKFITRFKGVIEKLDECFGSQLMLPGLKPEENVLRAKHYIELQKEAFSLYGRAVRLYGKCHGVDIEQTDTIIQMAAAVGMLGNHGTPHSLTNGAAIAQGASNAQQTQAYGSIPDAKIVNDTMVALMGMTVRKANGFNLQLPDDDMYKVIEANQVNGKTDKKKAH